MSSSSVDMHPNKLWSQAHWHGVAGAAVKFNVALIDEFVVLKYETLQNSTFSVAAAMRIKRQKSTKGLNFPFLTAAARFEGDAVHRTYVLHVIFTKGKFERINMQVVDVGAIIREKIGRCLEMV